MSTHTFAKLEVSAATHEEIKRKLLKAGYQHAFINQDGQVIIDMHGVGLVRSQKKAKRCPA